MGREIRRVPANWEHPKEKKFDPFRRVENEAYKPMLDSPFAPAMREWIAGWESWERGERPSHCTGDYVDMPYWEWGGNPPNPEYYRPDWPEEEMTWFQVYETVSEGTPVTPAFATKGELVDYLVENGDFWDQKRRAEGDSFMRCTPWPRKEAEAFVGVGWACSMAIVNGEVMSGTEAIAKQAQPGE
jgi:hypothetical protein